MISAATPTPLTTTWSVNYWQWSPTYGDDVTGTDALVAALKPGLMRVGGYNNDANTPDPFDDAQLDKAVAYARAIGAEPLIQVAHLADTTGQPATPAAAAAMVTYANVTKGYGIKYFSVGNEPDIYPVSGALADSTMPAIPGYTPAAYCASVTDFVAAMKAADPTIKIVGPDLAYKYQAGSSNDWLTPILTSCGDLFDIISIHRYPFEAKVSTLASAKLDPAAFRQVIASVRGIMQKTGYGDKPLALTEMNVAYDSTACVLDASPGTVGSALWLTDSIGAAIELGLWTSTVWDIADSEDWALGLIGAAPGHTPRPEYYAYSLFADHFGPTVLNVTSAPAGVSIHASRNQANDTTEIVAVNWNGTAAALTFQLTGLSKTPSPADVTLPATSIGAVEIPDTGTAKAWTYGEAQRSTASAPQALALGITTGGTDAGVDAGSGSGAGRVVGMGCSSVDAGRTCPQIVAPGPVITTMGSASGTNLVFGEGSDMWGSFTYATGANTAPSAAVTADGNGVQISGGSQGPTDYEGVGLYYSSTSCLNAAAYSGFKFDFAGTLGTCQLRVGISYSTDTPATDDAVRGTCTAAAGSCYGPLVDLTPAATAATVTAPTVKASFANMNGGSPTATADPTSIISVQWQLLATTSDGCTANFTVSNVSFY